MGYKIDSLDEIAPDVVAALRGAVGPPGATGATGPTGATGAMGPAGPAGPGAGAMTVVARATHGSGPVVTSADNSFASFPFDGGGATWTQGATEVDQFLMYVNWQPLNLVSGEASISVQLFVDGGAFGPDLAHPTPVVFQTSDVVDGTVPRILVPGWLPAPGASLARTLSAEVSSNGGSVTQQVNGITVYVLGTSSLGL